MKGRSEAVSRDDPFDLSRFLKAQERVYDRVLAELKSGQKRTHWMWYIFPQIDGLGYSSTTQHYAIKSLKEAQQYLDHPVLGKRLLECAQTVLTIQGRSVSEIFGYPDYLKLKSCMTLFVMAADSGTVFDRVLNKFFHGERDTKTIHILEKLKGK
jgi:uncharacterized protein (DUF1810 family)